MMLSKKTVSLELDAGNQQVGLGRKNDFKKIT